MPNLKDLKNRIESVKNTRKITKAMQMVAASKLRRAQERAGQAKPYSERMQRMLVSLASSMKDSAVELPLLMGNGSNIRHVIVVMSSDTGLCGGFNSSLIREVRNRIHELEAKKHTVQL